MSDLCQICGPVKHEAPTVICAPCALAELTEHILRSTPEPLLVRSIAEQNMDRIIKGARL